MNRIFQSSFSQYFTEFIKLRRVAGLDYTSQEIFLLKFRIVDSSRRGIPALGNAEGGTFVHREIDPAF